MIKELGLEVLNRNCRYLGRYIAYLANEPDLTLLHTLSLQLGTAIGLNINDKAEQNGRVNN